MTLDQLFEQFRVEADDLEAPHFWSDEELLVWFIEAQEEGAIRAGLLYEDSNDDLCLIATTADTHTYALHEAVIDITHASWLADGSTCKPRVLLLKDRDDLDRQNPNWRQCTGEPEFIIQDDGRARITPTPTTAGELRIECTRLPLEPLTLGNSSPELAAVHHRQLVHWVLFRAYSKPDAETLDEKRAALGEARFIEHFGPRVDADMRRSRRVEHDYRNEIFL